MRKKSGGRGIKTSGKYGAASETPGGKLPGAAENAAEETTKDLVEAIIQGHVQHHEEVDLEFLNDFLLETREHIEKIEIDVLALETDPTNIDLIHGLFREFHTIKGLAGFVNQNLIREISHQTESQLDQCRKGKAPVNRSVIDLILLASDHIKLICDNLSLNDDPRFTRAVTEQMEMLRSQTLEEQADETTGPKLGEILIEQGLDKETVEELLSKQEEYPGLRLGQVAIKEKKVGAREIIQSLRLQEKASRKVSLDSGYVRVPNHKLDNLGDMTGELLIIQSQIEREAIERFGPNDSFVNTLLRMEKISKNIQDLAMSLHMVSLRSLFLKINRIGRDTVTKLGKNVSLQILGEETEIDRGVAERILDPLVHLIKNSIHHGIESGSDRVARGKPEQGLVKIQAYSRRGSVYIVVSDDGRGIDLERVHEKAREKNLIDPAKTYGEEEILRHIFLPGFTTVENIDNISGRGVGLDVVKTEVSRIGGKVEVDNHPGDGCSFSLKIPITSAAINGTIVEMQGGSYIIPTLYIRQIVNPESSQWVSIAGNKALVRVKYGLVPVLPPARVFGLEGDEIAEEGELLVILELEQEYRALPIHGIIDRREIVVKPLGSEFSHLAYAAGASILGDGRVALILDVENLFKIGEAV